MDELDQRIYNAIKRLDWYFGEKKYVICGSVGLYIQGINLNREFHDFYIFYNKKTSEKTEYTEKLIKKHNISRNEG